MDDAERGYQLELILTKLRFAAASVDPSPASSTEGLQASAGQHCQRSASLTMTAACQDGWQACVARFVMLSVSRPYPVNAYMHGRHA